MRRFLTLLAVFALLAAACGGGDGGAETPTTTAAAAEGGETATTEAQLTETTAAPQTTSAPETTAAPTTAAPADTDGSPLLAAIAQSEQATSGRMEGAFVITGAEGMPAGTEFSIKFTGEQAANGDNTFIMDLSDAAGAAPGG